MVGMASVFIGLSHWNLRSLERAQTQGEKSRRSKGIVNLIGVTFSLLSPQHRSGGKGIRTPGLLIANETLYQLSYTPGATSIFCIGFARSASHGSTPEELLNSLPSLKSDKAGFGLSCHGIRFAL